MNHVVAQSPTCLPESLQQDKASELPTFFEKQLINYKQAARYLSVSEPYLRRLKALGKIPYVPLGSRGVRFRVQSLNEWVEKRERK